ncbi:MAG: long-chain fatty acid--CoA ligase [Desulfobacterales bacterium]|jgi:fatty-acyl-CoA synthase
MMYGDWIGRWGRAYPEKEALVDAIHNQRYTYVQLADDIHCLAHFLNDRLNIRRGDRVACLALNRAEIIKLFFALSRLGAILVPLNFRLASAEFTYYLEDATPKAIFFDKAHQNRVSDFKAKGILNDYICFDDDESVGLALPKIWPTLKPVPPPEEELGPDDPQLIIYTSGTSGDPKAVILTHGMITWNAINTNLGWDLRSDDKTILHAAMFYTAGWNVFTLPLFQCRGVNILIQSFDPDLILDLIAREGVTVFFGVPTMFQMLIESAKFASTDFSTVRFMVSGGAPLGHDIIETFKTQKSIRIWEGYGLTEVGPNNFMANGKPGTIGHPMPCVDVKIVDSDGNEVDTGTQGEILLKGPHTCAGYLNKPDASKKAFRDGWFRTGDLGQVDADGHYSIVGRLKDMIISGGANIYPAEIERVIETHPAVVGAAVIGVPDPKWGEVGKAIVELKSGASLSIEELQSFLKERLGKFKIPKYLAVTESLPRTPASEKIQKFILKERHGNADNA